MKEDGEDMIQDKIWKITKRSHIMILIFVIQAVCNTVHHAKLSTVEVLYFFLNGAETCNCWIMAPKQIIHVRHVEVIGKLLLQHVVSKGQL